MELQFSDIYAISVVTWTLYICSCNLDFITSHNKLYETADYLVRFISLELDHTQTGSTHPTPPQNHTYGQYFQKIIIHMDRYQCLDVFYSDR